MHNRYLSMTFIAMGFLFLLPVSLSAQQAGRNIPTFESFDLNSDGYLTQDEMQEARERRFQERQKEGRMMRNAKDHYPFSKIDADGDGKVTQKEFSDHQQRKRR